MSDSITRRGFLSNIAKALTPENKTITESKTIPVHSVSGVPLVNLENWMLTVNGLVEEPRQFSWEALQGFRTVETIRTMECIGNPTGGKLIGNATWKGIRFIDLGLNIHKNATHALFIAADSYQTAIGLDWLLRPDTLLAFEMNGSNLSPEHGFPLRLLVGGVYGQKMPKWINQIRFIDYPFQSFWETLGWSQTAEVQTHAIIQIPSDRAKVGGRVKLEGVAFAGLREIVGVDVCIDGGEWMPAQIVKGDSSLTWTRWSLWWIPYMAGSYTIEVRATDETGFTQSQPMSGKLNDARPNGSAYIHRIVVEVV